MPAPAAATPRRRLPSITVQAELLSRQRQTRRLPSDVKLTPSGIGAAGCSDGQFLSGSRDRPQSLHSSRAPSSARWVLLASLVDPIHGMDAQLLRNGTVVNYDQAHAKYLFASNYSVDWGPAPGSGLQVQGPFRRAIRSCAAGRAHQRLLPWYATSFKSAEPLTRRSGPILRSISTRSTFRGLRPTDAWIGTHGSWACKSSMARPTSMQFRNLRWEP